MYVNLYFLKSFSLKFRKIGKSLASLSFSIALYSLHVKVKQSLATTVRKIEMPSLVQTNTQNQPLVRMQCAHT